MVVQARAARGSGEQGRVRETRGTRAVREGERGGRLGKGGVPEVGANGDAAAISRVFRAGACGPAIAGGRGRAGKRTHRVAALFGAEQVDVEHVERV